MDEQDLATLEVAARDALMAVGYSISEAWAIATHGRYLIPEPSE